MSIAEVITATVAGLTPIGGGIAFIWNKVEKRFRVLEMEVEECRERDRQGQERRGVQLTVIELLWQEILRGAPQGSQVLDRAKKLLDNLKQPNGDAK